MSVTNLTITIAGTSYNILQKSFKLSSKIDQRSTCDFVVVDANSSWTFQKGQQVAVSDTLQGTLFTGFINTSQITKAPGTNTLRYHSVSCIDNHFLADKRTANKTYTNQYAGVVVAGMINDVLAAEGVTANYAIREDNTQAEFGQGTLSGTMATPNLGGDLELALAGSQANIIENTTSIFGNGTLTNMTASNNAVGPSPTSTLKIQATQSVAGVSNSYTYVKIFSSGSIGIISGRYLEYDIWISSSSPEARIGVDIVFTDGSTLRDNATSNNGAWFDAQNKGPHPNVDLKGLAVDQWYHRKFLLDNFSGKTIAYVTVAIEGDSAGVYTGYIKNIYETNGSGTILNTFFGGSLNVNPPQQMQKQGYGTTSVTVVNTYDCSTANRVSPSYAISAVNILRSSFLTYKTSLPTGYTISLSYSIDGGNSYTPISANNAALPNMLAGQSVSGKSIQFLVSFTQGPGADPTQQPTLTYMQATLYPSYTATKSDVNGEWTTNSQWNTSGTSFSNTQAPSNILMPFGAIRNWDTGDLSSQTLFGGGATGPNNANSCFQYVDSKQYRMIVHQSTEARSRFDFAGQWQNFQMEFDVSVDNASMVVGCFYRTTGISNYDAQYAYAVQIVPTSISLQRGSNSNSASNGTRTQIAIASVNLSSQAMHRIKIVVNGSSHTIYFDDTQVISATDGTYTSQGYVGFRISNGDASNGYVGTFDNFGISPTSLGGTWTSQSVSLTSAGTYLNSVVQWLDVSTDPTQVNNTVQSSTNGGSTWQTLTNGGSIPSLTSGQSLSSVSVSFKITFSANSSTVLPQMQYLTAYILGGFSSSGTRISPVLSLAPALIAGSTVVNWSAVTPANTSVAVAASPDGSSWTNVSNGGPIAGITTQPLATLDTFASNSSANYTSTNRTGGSAATWTFDTTNSRVTVSGGTNTLLLYSPVWFNTSYLNKKQIVINHAKIIGGADLSSFPVLISMIDSDLRTVANGGSVQNGSGFDIIFVNSAETSQLNHEIENYNPLTGEIEMWVMIPTLSHTSDTTIYIYFNNSGISTTQEHVTSVWDSNHKAVWHMDAATGSNQNDSTSNALTATQNNSPVQSTGDVDGALSFDGSSQYLSVAGTAANITGDKTIEVLINASSFTRDNNNTSPRILINNIDGTNVYQIAIDATGGGTIGFAVNDGTGQHIISNATNNISTWYHIVGTYIASSHVVTLYINGVSVANNGSLALGLGNTGFNIGRRTDALGYYSGLIDEMRVSNIVRSAGWIGTVSNSLLSPSTFFSVGAIQSQYTASNKDVDIVVDMDQADCAGIIWRETDASNFYELDIFDSSSSAGSTNVLKLYKVVANVKTQLGSNTAITFTRGTAYRVRVTMVGTAITIYFDGTSVLSTTDSALAGPGKVGLIEVSGSAHFYNLRIQPQGQSLSGVNAYTRVTLTSTDPTATPQLTDLVLAALHPNIALGSLIPTASYLYTYIANNNDDLAKKSNTYWKIDQFLNMIFATYQSVPAPWILTDKDILVDGLQVTNNGDLYRNRQIITGVIATGTDSEYKTGDGQTRSWTLGGILIAAPTIYLNGQLQTVGIKGIDTGKNFYWTLNSAVIDQDSSGTILQQTDQLYFPNYEYQYTTSIVVDNTGQFPGTISQAQFAALSGGTGIVEEVTDASSQALNVSAATAMANDLLQRNGVIGNEIQFKTLRSGLAIGQYLPIFNPETSLNDVAFLVTQIDMTQQTTLDVSSGNPTQLYTYAVTAESGPNMGSWSKLLASAVN